MKVYKAGTKVFCDFHFGGKPKGKVIRVIEPGEGRRSNSGKIEVQLTETVGAYKKGETLILSAFQAVPCAQEISLKKGQYFRRVNTLYRYE